MAIDIVWKDSTISSMYELGSDYLYGLAIDYERYVKDFGFIPINEFIQGWTCTPPHILETLKKFDNVYDYNGNPLVIAEVNVYNDDDIFVEVSPLNEDGEESSYSYILSAGEIYSYNVIHTDYFYKSIKSKGETLCPILITKTKQPQS